MPPEFDKQSFIQSFLYQQALLRKSPIATYNYDCYKYAISELRAEFVRDLRKLHFPGRVRAEYNDSLLPYCKGSYLNYLWAKDPTCRLCGFPIVNESEVTQDHIIPLSLGGSNLKENKQPTHYRCNHLKGNRLIVTLSELNTTNA